MGQARIRKAEIEQLKATDVAYPTSLEKYHQLTGHVPAALELAECDILPQFDKMMFGEPRDTEFYQPSMWRDAVVNGVGIRVRRGAESVVLHRPAYDDTVILSALEEGVARAMFLYSHVSAYTCQTRKPIRMGFFSIANEQAVQRFNALMQFAMKHFTGSKFFSFIN